MKMKDSFPIEIILTQSSMKNNSGDHSQTGTALSVYWKLSQEH